MLLTNFFSKFKGIFQPFELDSETRLIRSAVINWRPGKFKQKNEMIQSHERKHKTILSSLRISEMTVQPKSLSGISLASGKSSYMIFQIL